MLCPGCRRQLDRGGGFCLNCGMPRPGHVAPLELVLGDRTRVPVIEEMTIGRAPGSTVVLEDPTVSRLHARISGNNGDIYRCIVTDSAGNPVSVISGNATLTVTA